MNRNTTIAVIAVIVAALLAWAIYAGTKNGAAPMTATSTPSTTDNNNGTNPAPAPAPQAAVPSVTTGATAIPTDTTVVMTGSVVPNGAFTTYWYEYGVSANLGTKTTTQTVGSGFRAISAPAYVTGLVANTNYQFRLVAENAYGRVAGATYSFRTTQGIPPPRGSAPAPVTLSASGVSRTTANLNGTVDPNQAETQFWFEYGKTSSLGNTIGFISAGNGDAKVPVSVSVSNLDPLSTYFFRVNAQNQFGTVNGAIVTFKTSGPSAPTAPTAVTRSAASVGASTVTLRGTVNPDGSATTYWFEYSTDSLLGSVLLKSTEAKAIGSGTSDVSAATDVSGLASKTNYYYRIVAQNILGTVRGEKVSFRTK